MHSYNQPAVRADAGAAVILAPSASLLPSGLCLLPRRPPPPDCSDGRCIPITNLRSEQTPGQRPSLPALPAIRLPPSLPQEACFAHICLPQHLPGRADALPHCSVVTTTQMCTCAECPAHQSFMPLCRASMVTSLPSSSPRHPCARTSICMVRMKVRNGLLQLPKTLCPSAIDTVPFHSHPTLAVAWPHRSSPAAGTPAPPT